MSAPIVVVGGFAAAHTAVQLRDAGHRGPVVLLTDEAGVPYERPPLSKGYLLGTVELENVDVQPLQWYRDNDIDLRLSSRVNAIDTARHVVRTERGEQAYSQLVLATGAVPRRMSLADASDASIAYLRTVADSDRISAELHPERRIVIVGGGWIGLEVAAAAATAGAHVTVLEALETPLVRVLGREIGERIAQIHRDHGVDIRTAVSISAMSSHGVTLSDGTCIGADLIVVGIGVAPNDEVATAAGIATDNGILVDAALRTSAPDVFAIGDVANHDHPTLGRLRVEHWDTALGQARTLAATLVGEAIAYDRMPYFFSDQYDVGLEYVGHVGTEGYDAIVIRDGEDRGFVAWWLRNGVVLAGMHVNQWDAIEEIRQRVGTTPNLAELA